MRANLGGFERTPSTSGDRISNPRIWGQRGVFWED